MYGVKYFEVTKPICEGLHFNCKLFKHLDSHQI